MIDLRSDTVTRPTAQMLKFMMSAPVGDDVFGEDPSVNRLQDKMCQLTGKEAALFVPSGTMGNQICIKTHTQPGQEIILERTSHIYNYECGSPALLSGVQVLPVTGKSGSFTTGTLAENIRPQNVHHPRTRLVCLENTHNRSGGSIFPFEEIQKIYEFARSENLKLHLDGARLWNASIATGISIENYCQYFDSVSMCFSKGLGAPVGSIIFGSHEFIEKARFFRKAFGGGMRQAGIIAAAALYAVENHFNRMAEDHLRAKKIAKAISQFDQIYIDVDGCQTNIVVFDVKKTGLTGEQVVNHLAELGIKMLFFDSTKIRAVTHLEITDSDIEKTIAALEKIF